MVECLCAASILATSVGIALPNLGKWQQRQALISAAGELETDVQYARSLAVAQNAPLHFTIRTDAGGTCYVLHGGKAEDCTCSTDGGAQCTSDATVWRQASYPSKGRVKLVHRDASLTFNPDNGTVTPTTTFKLRTAADGSVHQVISIMGRTRSCSPDGVAGVKAC